MEHLEKVVKGVGPTVVAKTRQFLSDFRGTCVSAVDSRIAALHAMSDFYANMEEERRAYENEKSYNGQKNTYCTWLQQNKEYQDSRPQHALKRCNEVAMRARSTAASSYR